MRRLLSEDPLSGMRRWFEGDGQGGFSIHSEPMHPVANVDFMGVLRNESGDERWKTYTKAVSTPVLEHYANIPMPLIHALAARGVDVYDPLVLMQFVNNPEYAYLRSVTQITHGIPEDKDAYKDAGESLLEAGVISK